MKSVISTLVFSILALPTLAVPDLSDMKIAILGDSMTWIGGDSCRNQNGWTRYFTDMTSPAGVDIYARSGATWTNTRGTRPDTADYSEVLSDRNVIYNQALRLIEDTATSVSGAPDLILIYAGANDVWFHNRRPGIFDPEVTPLPDAPENVSPASVTSLAGSIELVCRLISGILPESRIILMTPVEMSKAPAAMTAKVSDIIARTGERLGLQVLRTDRHVPIRHETERRRPTFTTDGVHTNPGGAILIGNFVTRSLTGNDIQTDRDSHPQ